MNGSLVQIEVDTLIVLIVLLDLFIWLVHDGFGSVHTIMIFLFHLELEILLSKLAETTDYVIEMFVLLLEHLDLISQLIKFVPELFLLFHPFLFVIN